MRVFLAALVVPQAAHASASVEVGATEVVAAPESSHVGLYLEAGVSPFVADVERWSFAPTVGANWAPDAHRWGLFGAFTVEYALDDDVGLDLDAILAHDQPGARWQDASYSAGIGAGVSIAFGDWSVTPELIVLRDIASGDHVVGFALGVARDL